MYLIISVLDEWVASLAPNPREVSQQKEPLSKRSMKSGSSESFCYEKTVRNIFIPEAK